MSDADPAFTVDIPVVVTPDMAEDIRDDLEQKGRVSIEVRTANAPDVVEQIEWQLENEQPLLEFTEDYDDE